MSFGNREKSVEDKNNWGLPKSNLSAFGEKKYEVLEYYSSSQK